MTMFRLRRAAGLCAATLTLTASEALAAPTLLKQIALPGAPFDGIAITPDGSKLYVSLVKTKNPGLNTIAVIDTASLTVTDEIELGDQGANNSSPRQLYMAPDGKTLVHATYVDNLLFIDTATDTLIDSLPGVGSAVAVFTGDSSRLWSRDSESKTVRVLDLADLSLLATFPVLSPGSSDFPLLITPDGARVYAVTSNDGGNGFNHPQAITAFDAPGLKLLKHYGAGVGFMANAGADARISPDGAYLYTSGSNMTTISKLEIASDAEVDSVALPQYGEGLNLSPDGATLYAFENGYNSGQLRVHDAATLDLIKTVDTQGQVARFLATSRKTVFAPSGCAVIVPAPLQTAIYALDPVTHAKIASFPTPNETAYTVEFQPNSARAYLPSRSNNLTGTLTILDLGESCAKAPNGAPCEDDADCADLHCIDAVCCDSACGDGSPDDCQACSVKDGAAVDGTCGPISADTICRAAMAGGCEEPASCDGVDLECPPNPNQPDGAPCDGGMCQGGACTPEDATSTGDPSTGGVSTSDPGTGGSGTGTGDPSTGGVTATTGPALTTGGEGTGGSGSGTGGDSDAPTTGPGATSTTGGSGDSSGDGSGSDSAGEGAIDDGCGCRGAGERGGSGALLLLGLALLRPRRRGRPTARAAWR